MKNKRRKAKKPKSPDIDELSIQKRGNSLLPTKEYCCGCGACANSCPENAIKMSAGSDGFLYPSIDESKCVGCGICEKSCPFLNDVELESVSEPKAYIVQNKDECVLKHSTSGGAFTAIAINTVRNGGVVFGAAIDDEYCVSHIFATTENELEKFRNSKYVQSKTGDAYSKAKKFLEEGREVCFSGTPCQISGLYRYLGKQYDNLITVDVVCRSVPSPMVLDKYVEYQKVKHPEMKRLVFRDKKRGYSYSNIAIFDGNDRCLYRAGSESDPWLRLFLGEYCSRLSCYNCKYQSSARPADFTIWDCWNARSLAPQLDNNKGVSFLFARSLKAQRTDLSAWLNMAVVNPDTAEKMLESRNAVPRENRDAFFSDCKEMSAEAFFEKYAPITLKIKMKALLRKVLLKLHLHDAIRRAVHKVKKQGTDNK